MARGERDRSRGVPLSGAISGMRLALSRAVARSRMGLILVLAACVLGTSLAHAATYYVDGANPQANDSNPGTEALPYRTIQVALNQRAFPGNTIFVKPAIYREQVNVARSGANDNPFILQGLGAGVIVDGADDFSTPAQWSQVSGNVYLAASVSWGPIQVFVNGQRLAASTDSPSALPANTFRWVTGTGLYVNAGGGNPGAQQTFVGHRTYGIRMSTRTWVEIRNLTVTRTEDRGIYLSSGSDFSTVAGNTVTFGGKYGIAVTSTNNVTVEGNYVSDHLDHGIYLGTASDCVVRGNESLRNARPASRAANGIYLTGSTNNRIESNRLHHNQDTGLHFQGSSNNLSLQNRSWSNGDHGYDHLSTSGVVHIGDVAYGNFKDGFSIEGKSPGNTVMNCIAVNNGLTTNEFNLWVDSASSVDFSGDYNIFWNSTPQDPIKFIGTHYATVAAYSQATGQDLHSTQADPRFVDPANGDFHLFGGSPAIDAGNASIVNWSATDAEGGIRHDDPSTVNTGVGTVPFSDRGALEFMPPGNGGDQAPVVSAPSTMTGGEGQPLTFEVAVTDPDGQPISSLTANLSDLPAGHDAVFTTNASHTAGTLIWTPSFTDGRLNPYIVSFTASNSLSATASTAITIANVDRAPVVVAPATKSGAEDAMITVFVNASDPDGDAIASLVADFSGLPPGNNAVFTPNANKSAGTMTWTPTFADSGGPYPVFFIASNALGGRDTTLFTVTNVDRTPVVTVPATASGTENTPLSFTVTAADPDGDPITSLAASGMPAGATFTPAADHRSGTFDWTPSFDDAGGPYNVTFSAINVLVGSSVTGVTVSNVDRQPIVIGPATASATEGQPLMVTVNASDPDGQTLLSLSASGLPPGATFTPNGANTSGTLSWTPGYDATPGPYVVTFTTTNSLSGTSTTSISVANVDRAPEVTAPATAAAAEGQVFTLDVTAADPDGEAVASLAADLAGLPGGNATFVPNGTHTSGRLTWTPPVGSHTGGPYTVVFQAANTLTGAPVSTSISVDRAPVVVAPPTASATENATLSFTVTASDPDGEAIALLAATGLPSGATFVPNGTHTSGTFTWTPAFGAAPGPYVVTFTATNAASGAATTSISVANIDRAPVVVAPASTPIVEGQLVTVTVTASDPDGDAIASLTANLSSLPPANDASFVTDSTHTSGTLTWTPRAGDAAGGPYSVFFTAANAASGSDTTQLLVDHVPVVTAPATRAATENVALSFQVAVIDPDGQPITSLSASGMPNGATFTPDSSNTSGTFQWTPGYDMAPGPYLVTFTAANSRSGSATTSISVANVDRAPAVTAPPSEAAAVGTPLSFTVTVTDPDLDSIASLAATGLPPGATFTSNGAHTSGTFDWTPPSGSPAGPFTVTFTAQNALTATATTSISLDRPPAVTAPASQTVAENAPLSFTVTAVDPDGQPIASLVASGLPAGATFTPNGSNSSGTFQWTPGYAAAPGPYAVTFTATNALSGSATTGVAVSNVDRAPVMSVASTAAVNENQQLTLVVNVSDPDGDAVNSLTVDITALPVGSNASFTTDPAKTQGTLTWTPTSNDGRSAPYNVTFTAANALASSVASSITVVDAITNLCPNPSFENNTASWNAYGGSTVTRVAGGHEGAFSLQVKGPSSTSAFGANDTPNFVSSTTGGVHYRYTAWVRSAANTGQMRLRIREYTTGGAQVGATTLSSPVALSPAWQLLTLEYVANGGGNSLDFQVLDNVPAVTGETFLLDNITVAVVNPANPPVVTAPAFATVAENGTISIDVTAADPDGDPITSFTADVSGLPAGNNASFVTNPAKTAGTFTWTPTFADGPVSYTVTFRASNALSGGSSTTISVTNVDRAPAVSSPASQTVAEGTALAFSVTAADPDAQPITSLSATGLPAGATFTPNGSNTGGTFNWTPGFAAAGPYSITFTAQNALSGSATTALTVTDVDRAPVVTAPASESVAENAPLAISVTAADPDGETIASLTATGLPPGATFTPNDSATGGTVAWTPGYAAAPASYSITFTAHNALSGSATTALTVTNVDRAPELVAPATANAFQGQPFTMTVTASDPDGETITSLQASGLPSGATFTPDPAHTSGTLDWTPDPTAAPGPYLVTFTAQNALSDSKSTSIIVNAVDRAPVVSAPGLQTVAENAPLSITVTASDPDGQSITSLTASGLPAGATFTPDGANTSGTLAWTPGFSDAGSYAVTFTAQNTLTGTASTSITVTNTDRAPVVTAPATHSGSENAALTVTVAAADPDGDAITALAASGLPAGASFTPDGSHTSGVLSWTPGFSDAGSYTVSFTATNAISGSATTELIITNVDRAPVVTAPANASINVGQQVSVSVTVADPDGEPITSLVADVTALPGGNNAKFTPNGTHTAGTLTWTPTSSDGRTAPYNVVFIASNAASGSGTTAITVTNPITNLCANPSFESNLTGWGPTGSSTLGRVAGGQNGAFACQVLGPGTTGQFGLNDSPNIVMSTTAGRRYRYSLWVRSATNVGQAKLKLREYTSGGSQVGATLYSTPLTLSSTWQVLTLDFIAGGTGNTLDFQVLDTPVATEEVFLADNVVVAVVSGAEASLAMEGVAVDEGGSGAVTNLDPATPELAGTGSLELRASMAPNPARESARFTLVTPRAGFARARLYDVRGRMVRTLLDERRLEAGVHAFPIDRHDDRGALLPSGLYFYRLESVAGDLSGRWVVIQ